MSCKYSEQNFTCLFSIILEHKYMVGCLNVPNFKFLGYAAGVISQNKNHCAAYQNVGNGIQS